MVRGIDVFVTAGWLADAGDMARVESASPSAPNYAWVWWLVGALLLLVAAGIIFLIRRRRMQQPVDITDDIDRAAQHARVRDVRDELAEPEDTPADGDDNRTADSRAADTTEPDDSQMQP